MLTVCTLCIATCLIVLAWKQRRRSSIALSFFFFGTLIGPFFTGTYSPVNWFQVFVDDRGRDDQIVVPHTLPSPFSNPTATITYPGGAQFLATQPVVGHGLNRLDLYYGKDGFLNFSCRNDPAEMRGQLFSPISTGPEQRPVRLEFISRKSLNLVAILGPSPGAKESDRPTIRLLYFTGGQVLSVLKLLAEADFPETVDVWMSESDGSRRRLLEHIEPIGVLQPITREPLHQVKQPKSNPFKVMQTFCSGVQLK